MSMAIIIIYMFEVEEMIVRLEGSARDIWYEITMAHADIQDLG